MIFLIFTLLCGVIYTGVVTGIAQLIFSDNANGSIIEVDGKKYGCELLGQQYTDEERTQRQTQVLKNVRYRIRARICPRPLYAGSLEQLYRQAMRRIRSGKTFMQPCLGLREFVCYFEESDGSRPPIDVSMDLGLMVYDVFDLHDEQVRKVTKPKISLYHAVMEHGVIRVPDYDSEDVLKGGTAAC